MYGLVKLANEQKEQNNHALAATGALAGGAAGAYAGGGALTGTKRVYHGTSQENWEKIKSEGLRRDVGAIGGASWTPESQEASKGLVHLTGKRDIGNYHANFHDMDQSELLRKNMIWNTIRVKDDLFDAPKNGKGKVISGRIPYDKWKQMEIDPIMNGQNIKYIESLPETTPAQWKYFDRVMRNEAVRGPVDVLPVELDGGDGATLRNRLSHFGQQFPDYVKKYPGRFGMGLAALGGGALLGGAAGMYGDEQLRK